MGAPRLPRGEADRYGTRQRQIQCHLTGKVKQKNLDESYSIDLREQA